MHIFSCHSGAAQHNINDIDGNVILCTYAPATNYTRGRTDNNLFKNYNNSKNLIEFIVNNLPLLTVVNFTVSYKINGKVQTLSLDHSTIKTMNMVSFAEFLQKQYQKVKEFYKLQEESHSEYIELFSTDNFPEMKQYTDNELKYAFSSALNIYAHELTNSEIQHLLKIDSSNR
ncbi:MAG: hypothetical protein ACRYE8_03620 [Janthinobacterium lividum]